MNQINQSLESLIRLGIAVPSSVQGCSEEEVALLEADAGFPLPSTYREFLFSMGRGAGRLFVGSDFFYPTIVGLRQDAEELLEEDDTTFRLPSDAFVFLMHQGYQFMYFLARLGDDPPVLHYCEGDDRPQEHSESFSSFLRNAISDHQSE